MTDFLSTVAGRKKAQKSQKPPACRDPKWKCFITGEQAMQPVSV
jgi:hypothetical protein